MGVETALIAAAVVSAGATAYSVTEQQKARKDQAAAQAKAEAEAKRVQDEQAAFAAKEKADAEAALAAEQQSAAKKRSGRGGLLFGGELGVQPTTEDENKRTTLGV